MRCKPSHARMWWSFTIAGSALAQATRRHRRRPVGCRATDTGADGASRRNASLALVAGGVAAGVASAPPPGLAPLPPPGEAWAVVTGASSGIGAAIARCLAAQGFGLYLCARRREPLEQLAAELRSGQYRNRRVEVVVADLAEPAGAQSLCDAVGASGGDVALVVVNAGRAWTGQFVSQPVDNLRELLALNVAGTAETCRLFAARMVSKGRGRLLMVSSVAGSTNGVAGTAAYAGSKSFVRALAQGLRTELLPHGVGVTSLLPGATDSNFQQTAGMERALCFNVPLARELGIVSSSEFVAEQGVQAVLRGDAECVPGLLNTIVTLLPTFASRALAELSFADAPWLADGDLKRASAAGAGIVLASTSCLQPALALEPSFGMTAVGGALALPALLLAGLIYVNVAENGAMDSAPGETKVRCLEDAMALSSKTDFVASWRAGVPPRVPAGRELSGRLLPLGALWASSWAITNFLFAPGPGRFWLGKGFAADGATGYNVFQGDGRLRPFKATVEPSLLDGQPCLALVYGYSEGDALWGGVLGMRDELREVSPGLFLGLGSMRATGGMWNCAPFVLFAEEE